MNALPPCSSAAPFSHRRRLLACVVTCLTIFTCAHAFGADPAVVVTPAHVRAVVAAHFEAKKDFEPSDLIDRGDAKQILAELEKLGWQPDDADELLELLLPEGHILPRTLATPDGKHFMRKVARFNLVYDRLHRTSELPGGDRLVRDIVKLPNAEIYVKAKPVRGTPTLTDLLPKQRNGKIPKATDFDKPTGYIYTVDALLKHLEKSLQQSQSLSSN